MKKRIALKVPTVENIVILGLVFNLFLMRPAALGGRLSSVAIVVSVVLGAAYLIITRKRPRFTNPQLRIEMFTLGALIAAFWLYNGPITILNNRANLDFTIKELVTTLAVVIPYAIVLVDTKANGVFFRQLCTIVSLLGLSSLITVVLTSLLGSRDPLFLYTLDVKGYTEMTTDQTAAVGAIYFPISMLYSDFVSGAVTLDRFCGFFREAGIYQAVACFFLAYEAFTRRSLFVLLGLASGAILTFSSLGIVLLVLTVGLIYLFGPPRLSTGRIIVATVMIGLAYPVAIYTPFIGMADKSQTHEESVSDRSAGIESGIRAVSENPLGTGLFTGTGESVGICLLSSLGMIGVFGFICQFLILSGWRPGSQGDWRKVVTCVPILVTALVSEPIDGAPMIYVMVMAFIPPVRRELAGMRQRAIRIRPAVARRQPELGSDALP